MTPVARRTPFLLWGGALTCLVVVLFAGTRDVFWNGDFMVEAWPAYKLLHGAHRMGGAQRAKLAAAGPRGQRGDVDDVPHHHGRTTDTPFFMYLAWVLPLAAYLAHRLYVQRAPLPYRRSWPVDPTSAGQLSSPSTSTT